MSQGRGLFIGRFQPMHLGHLHVLRKLASQHQELLVGVGSANVSHTAHNPFTGGERVEMVHDSLREAGVTNALVLPLPDIGRNTIWVSHVTSLVPRFGVLYSNNPLAKRLFEEAGHQVAPAPYHERDRFVGTQIRERMLASKEWQSLVPPAAARVIASCRGVERLRDITSGESHVVEGREAGL